MRAIGGRKSNWLGSFTKDSLYTMIGLTAMNGVAQFVVYPSLRSIFGASYYGKILTMLAVVNIAGLTIGQSLNNARLVAKSRGERIDNTPYFQFLAMTVAFVIVLAAAVLAILRERVTAVSGFLYVLLIFFTILKYYSEVEYRLNKNYAGLLLFYLIITAGYFLGLLIIKWTGLWMTALIFGEALGFAFVFFSGSIYRQTRIGKGESFRTFWDSVKYLMAAQLLVNLVFNSDRFIILAFCGSGAVTVFYVASAVGKMVSLLTTALNSVIIGYLANRQEMLKEREFKRIFYVVLLAIGLLVIMCFLGSILYVKVFYPEDYDTARPYFFAANLAQILYFMSGVFTTLLLRYESEHIQTKINIHYVGVFLVFAVGLSALLGIWGYTIGLLVSNLFRLLYAAGLCKRCFSGEE